MTFVATRQPSSADLDRAFVCGAAGHAITTALEILQLAKPVDASIADRLLAVKNDLLAEERRLREGR